MTARWTAWTMAAAWLAACGPTPSPGPLPAADTSFGDTQLPDTAADTGDVAPDGAAADVADTALDSSDSAGTDAEDAVDATDTKPKDTAPTKEQLCEGYVTAYADAQAALAACTKDSDCSLQLPDKLKCGCGHFVNAGHAALGDAQKALQDFVSHKCSTGFCGDLQCADLTTSLGKCADGKCSAEVMTCEELSQGWQQLLGEVQVCGSDGDCSGSADAVLGCGCPVPVSAALVADGTATGLRKALIEKLWGDLGCQPAVCPGCVEPAKATCAAGKCQGSL